MCYLRDLIDKLNQVTASVSSWIKKSATQKLVSYLTLEEFSLMLLKRNCHYWYLQDGISVLANCWNSDFSQSVYFR